MAKQIIPNHREPYKQITIRLPESVLTKLELLAEESVQTKSQYLIKMLQRVDPPNPATEAVNPFWAPLVEKFQQQQQSSWDAQKQKELIGKAEPIPDPGFSDPAKITAEFMEKSLKLDTPNVDKEPVLTDLQLKICSWFHRKPSTKWTDKEIRAYKHNAHKTSVDDVTILDRYYTAKIPEDTDYRRRDIVTLLNNWPGEIDRARTFVTAIVKKRAIGQGWINSKAYQLPVADNAKNITPEEVKAGIEELRMKISQSVANSMDTVEPVADVGTDDSEGVDL